jgi:hypothetical protein
MKNLACSVSRLLMVGALVMAGCSSTGDPGAAGKRGDAGSPGAPGGPGQTGTDGEPGDAGDSGTDGEDGANGDAGVSTAPLNFSITNSLTGAPVSGVVVAFSPAGAVSVTTDASGKALAPSVPAGSYTLTLTGTGYTTLKQKISVQQGVPATVALKLVPAAKVGVDAGKDLSGVAPGSNATLTGSAIAYDGSTITGYSWAKTAGPAITLVGSTNNPSLNVTLPNASVIKAALVQDLNQPARLGVVGINPHAIESATTVTLTLTVTTTSGSYTDTVNVIASAPFQVTTSLRNVPLGIPQLLQADPITSGSYSWSVTSKPIGSTAVLQDATSQLPYITPDLIGTYVIAEATTGGSITLTAGNYAGAITGLSLADGLPLSDNCTGCHAPSQAAANADMFPAWRASGHAQIFSQNVDDPANHWSIAACASCHTVGYTPGETATNGGFYDQQKLAKWVQPPGAPDVYAKMITNANPDVAKLAGLANVQCENCHGPNGSPAHMASRPLASPERVSLAAEVCGSCHGEPLRHGRYQQWQESGHGNYALAIQRADAKSSADKATTGDNSVNSCGRCHSAEGFIVWHDQSDTRGGNYDMLIQGSPTNGNGGNATGAELRAMGLTAATVHSQTCTACHDPHAQGDTSGEPNTAKIRIFGDVSMSTAGYPLVGLGKGTLCATCHNSRNGLHNDTITTYGSSGIALPHDSTATDVLLGQNAYFVTLGQRGGHSYITNTCTNCHMELSPPPEEFSYQRTGTNHSFAADISICSNCHGAYDGGSIKTSTQASLTSLTKFIGMGAAKALNGKVFWARAQRPATATLASAYSHAAAANASDLSAYNILVDLTTAGANNITSAMLLEDTSNIQITLAKPVQITWTDATAAASVSTFIISMSNIRNDDGTGTTPMATFPISLTGNLAKAIWNYITLYREGSFGIHNPGFTNQVITATLAKDLSL